MKGQTLMRNFFSALLAPRGLAWGLAVLLAALLVLSAGVRMIRLNQAAYFLSLSLAQEGQMEEAGAGRAPPLLLRAGQETGWQFFVFDRQGKLIMDSVRDSYGGWVETRALSPNETGLSGATRSVSRRWVERLGRDAIAQGSRARPAGVSRWVVAQPIEKVRQSHGSLVIVDSRAPELALLLLMLLGLMGWGGFRRWQAWQSEKGVE